MRISKCRICGNKSLTKIGSLGKIAISDFTDTPQNGSKFPLELIYCETCTLLQLSYNTPRDLLYMYYWYESGLNPVVVADLKEIAHYCRGVTISIGENDGTLLRNAKCDFKLAVDPSNIEPKGKNIHWIQDYWENVYTVEADVIVAIACLYDLPNPNKFIKNVKKHLADNGLFISQFQPLEQMIELNDVGNICHEHLEYYSYKSLVYLFEQNGLEIFKVERNKMNGGSYRVFARHFKKRSIKFKEKDYGVKELKAFMTRIEKNKLEFQRFCFNVNGTIVGYGASTKGQTITSYYNAFPMTTVDINPRKLNKYAYENSLIIDKIPKDTQYLWVFPYGFIDYFRKKEKNYKGKWITTIPKFKIYD